MTTPGTGSTSDARKRKAGRGTEHRREQAVSACEECWDEAFFRSRLTGRLQADIYRELLAENEQAHTTTEGTDHE